ncbi:hypothetical protein BC628DRAFT_1424330 [Trametes gibbosa]|nr:hypothetical protein BC628DRAFT_1424330 [Trametes gibbosa]
MSNPQHAAVVILESVLSLALHSADVRNHTRDATLENVSSQGLAVKNGLSSAVLSLSGWVNAISQLDKTPFDDNVAARVVDGYAAAVTVYSDLMKALAEKHDILVSPTSPLAPDGAVIGQEIAAYQFVLAVYQQWLAGFVPTRLDELEAQGKLAFAAYELAAARYPAPQSSGASVQSFKAVVSDKLELPKAPATQK